MNELVFVYGTLKRGFGNWSYLLKDQSVFKGEHTITNGYRMHSLGGFPAVVPSDKGLPIHGEVFEVDQLVFKRLDDLEGYPDMYQRVKVDTQHGEAWMYVMDEHDHYIRNAPIVESGIW